MEDLLVFTHEGSEYKVVKNIAGKISAWRKLKERKYSPVKDYKNRSDTGPVYFGSVKEAKNYICQKKKM